MATDRATLARAAYDAYGRADRAAFEALVADGFRFWSPQDDGIDRAAFFERCWPAGERSTFRVVRLMTDGDEAMVTYEATRPDGTRFRNTEVLTFAGDQLVKTEVYFGWDL